MCSSDLENKPGGGGLVAMSWFYAQAPRDGSVMGVLPETVGNTQLMEPDVGKWNVAELNYIGSFASANSAFVRRRNSPSQTVADMKTRETVAGCTGVTAQSFQYPALLKVLGGFRFRMICGYPGANEYTLALERGEIDLVSSAWNSWRVTHRPQIEKGDLVPVIQAGMKRHRELPDAPLMPTMMRFFADPLTNAPALLLSCHAAVGHHAVERGQHELRIELFTQVANLRETPRTIRGRTGIRRPQQGGVHIVGVKGLGEVVRHPRRQTLLTVPDHGVRRHSNNRHVGITLQSADLGRRLVPIHSRQLAVHEDGVELLTRCRFAGDAPVLGAHDAAAIADEEGLRHTSVPFHVVHHEDAKAGEGGLHVRRVRWQRHRAPACAFDVFRLPIQRLHHPPAPSAIRQPSGLPRPGPGHDRS